MIKDYLEKIKKQLDVACLCAVIYARYSSDMQRSESIDAQVRLISDFAKDNNIIIVGKYIDEAQSGKRDNRIQFQQMISDAKTQRHWQLVLVHKLDRFARNRIDSAIYRTELRKSQKFLISATEQFDDSPESSMMEAIIEAMAEYYSKNLAREVMKGLTENALKGMHCGGKPPLGYDVQDNMYVVNQFEAQAVRLIFSMFLDGKGYGEIIKALNNGGYRTKRKALFVKNSLQEILRNEKYTGTFVYNKVIAPDTYTGKRNNHKYKTDDEIIRVENAFTPIISKEDFVKVQGILRSRKRVYTNHAKEVYLLTGKLKCGCCGGSYVGTRKFNSQGKKYVTYQCNINQRSIHTLCSNGSINRDWLENLVINAINDFVEFANEKTISGIYQEYLSDIEKDNLSEQEAIKKKIASVDAQLNRISDVISLVNSETLIARLMDYERQKSELINSLEKLCMDRQQTISIEELKQLLKKAKQMLKEKSIPKMKELINLIVKEIIVNKDSVVIYLNFGSYNNNEFRYAR